MSGPVERSLRSKLGSRTKTIAAMLVTIILGAWLVGAAVGQDDGHFRFGGIFQIFRDDDGWVQSLPNFSTVNGSHIDGTNTFFKTSFGTNGQSCATCHQPRDGFTIHVSCGPDLPNCLSINSAFDATDGLDPLFRLNDTANRPDADVSTVDARRKAYSLTLALGVTRIDKGPPAAPIVPEFVVAPQNTDEFGPLPNAKGQLALFRRPLVPTNMRFDSAVLWDGRQSIRNIQGQVEGAAKALLLNPGTDANFPADANDVANFMLGAVTDQVIDDRDSFPPSHAGSTSAEDARSGVRNLHTKSFSANAPCLYDVTGARTTSVTPAVTYYPADGPGTLTPSTCRPVVQGGQNMTDFKPWLEFQRVANQSDRNFSRASIARGEEIFNRAVLHVPSDIVIPGLQGDKAHCTTCHATNNLGNHPDANFFVRIGSDSVPILQELADAHPETPSLQDFVTRTKMLPQYCLRSVATGAPTLNDVACGHYEGDSTNGIPGDVITSDPGRAMVTGKWADIGKFKPPILRGLAPRSPYFHGSAADSTVSIVEFYNARFNIGLSEQQKEDLVRFLEAH